MGSRSTLVAATLSVLVLTSACAEPAGPTEQAGGRLLAFMSDPTGDFEIYLLDPSREDIRSLTAHPGFDGFPHFHPDGQSLLFTSERIGGDQEIYRMSRDGTDVVRLTDSPGRDFHATYSPDASRIVFASERDEDTEIYIMNADGSGQTRLTDSPGSDFDPVFSPDGDRIYFVSERAGYREILRMGLDGSNLESVVGQEGEFLYRPTFDPGTGRLVYTRSPSASPGQGLTLQVWQVEPDGSGATRFQGAPLGAGGASFSPDGLAMAFSVLNVSDEDLLVLNVASGELDRITNSSGRDLWPTFDPTSGR